MNEAQQFFFIIAVAVFLGEIGHALPPQAIVGGRKAILGEFPYQVGLKLRGVHFCGGAIIGDRYIITAAHCVAGVVSRPYNELRVAVGTISSARGTTYGVKSVVAHEKFNRQSPNLLHDIALIELMVGMQFNTTQQAINLPTKNPIEGSQAIASGWGLESPNSKQTPISLMKTQLTLLNQEKCRRTFSSFAVTSFQICTIAPAGRGVCSGDSGGPLVVGRELVGLVSFGVAPCAHGAPDVFTNVFMYRDWINKTIEGFKAARGDWQGVRPQPSLVNQPTFLVV